MDRFPDMKLMNQKSLNQEYKIKYFLTHNGVCQITFQIECINVPTAINESMHFIAPSLIYEIILMFC